MSSVGLAARTVPVIGWPLVGWSALVLGAIVGASLAAFGFGQEGMRFVLRVTALTSLLLFTGAFVASALERTWPGPVSRFLLLNRRYLGVSFAVSHLYHLIAILSLAALSSKPVANPVTVVAGGLGFVFIAAMVATSFDRTAAYVGPRRWRLLHATGVYYIWLIFALTYLPSASRSPWYALIALWLVAGLGVRIYGRRRPRRAVA
jgi:hypothetical protein